ncbi:MAG TPA: archaellin/type IV pilin N-terminal domain-containing protein [Candidatus Nanoarchaeia archaeon]|nr:archaellin/type IV pilin N-terminal domain-containing protein [Candidatus Nanoarchaeia archaeon]
MATKKRGISPLIASVLLIGFTIVLAALVFRWGGQLFNKTTQDTGCASEGSIRCSQSVKVSLSPSTGITMLDTASDTITLSILSEADQAIDDVKVRLTKCSGETIVADTVVLLTDPLPGYGSTKVTATFSSGVGALTDYDPVSTNANCQGKYSGVGILPVINFITSDGKQCNTQVCGTEYKYQFLEADVS